jgi:predicted DNA-binding transcriptional regulator YafY
MTVKRRSLSRIDRVDTLVRVLRDRPGITAAELALQLRVSIRSVFRDLDHLRERGYPIEAAVGRGGGLRLDASWGLGRVLFTREEALSALLSLAVAQQLNFPILSGEVDRTRRKLVDAFPAAERRRIAPLRERVFMGPPASRAVRASYREPDSADLCGLQSAFLGEHVVRAVYQKEAGARTERRLEPHALVINWPAWYLMAFDKALAQPRTFRLDRFVRIDEEEERFSARPKELARDLLEAGVPLHSL